MSKPRINAKVAKLDIGKPYQWSATGIGVVALDNALEAGHLIIVEMGDENEYWVMRPTVSDLQNMIKSVTRFGKTVYSFPAAQDQPEATTTAVETETASTEQEIEMTTTTTTPTAAALDAFSNATEAQSIGDRTEIASLIAALHAHARSHGLDWKSILAEATDLYKAQKPVAEPKVKIAKASKQTSGKPAGQAWTLRAELPNGQVVEVQRSKPYSFASLIDTGDGWQVWAWVSSKDTAAKRIGDAKRSGQPVKAWKVVEVQIVDQPAPSFDTDRAIMAERAAEDAGDQLPDRDMDGSPFYAEPTAEDEAAYREYQASGQEAADIAELVGEAEAQPEQPATPTWPYTEALPFEDAQDAQDTEAEDDIEEPMHVKIVGGAAVHYSDDGDATYCGIDGRDLRQVHDAITCRSCQKVALARITKA